MRVYRTVAALILTGRERPDLTPKLSLQLRLQLHRWRRGSNLYMSRIDDPSFKSFWRSDSGETRKMIIISAAFGFTGRLSSCNCLPLKGKRIVRFPCLMTLTEAFKTSLGCAMERPKIDGLGKMHSS